MAEELTTEITKCYKSGHSPQTIQSWLLNIEQHTATDHSELLEGLNEVTDTKHSAQCLVHDKIWELLLLIVTPDALTLLHFSYFSYPGSQAFAQNRKSPK